MSLTLNEAEVFGDATPAPAETVTTSTEVAAVLPPDAPAADPNAKVEDKPKRGRKKAAAPIEGQHFTFEPFKKQEPKEFALAVSETITVELGPQTRALLEQLIEALSQ